MFVYRALPPPCHRFTCAPAPSSSPHTYTHAASTLALAQARIRSVVSQTEAIIRFVNDSEQAVRAVWLNFEGNEVSRGIRSTVCLPACRGQLLGRGLIDDCGQ